MARWWHRLYLHEGPRGINHRTTILISIPAIVIFTDAIVFGGESLNLVARLIYVVGIILFSLGSAAIIWHSRHRALAELKRRRLLVEQAEQQSSDDIDGPTVSCFLNRQMRLVLGPMLPDVAKFVKTSDQIAKDVRILSQFVGLSANEGARAWSNETAAILREVQWMYEALEARANNLTREIFERETFEDVTREDFAAINRVFGALYAAATLASHRSIDGGLKEMVEHERWKKIRAMLE
jgi:hypothetical protein